MAKEVSFSKRLEYLWFALRSSGLPLILRAARYGLEKSYAELKYAEPIQPRGGLKLWLQALRAYGQTPPAPPPSDHFTRPGSIQAWKQREATVVLTCERCAIQIEALTPVLIRVRLNEAGLFNTPFSYAIDKAAAGAIPSVTVSETDAALQIETEALLVRVNRQSGAIDFLDRQGQPINLDAGGMGWHEGWVRLERTLPPDASVFGLGERAFGLNLRGHRFENWNRDPGGRYGRGDDPLYQSHPWFISLHQQRAFGLLFDNSHATSFDMGQTQAERYTITAPAGELRYYFSYGPTIKAVLASLAELTGAMPLPPLWALGLHQSRWSYGSENAVRQIARSFRARCIPCDAIHLDIDAMQGRTSFTWHKGRFPDPQELIKTLRITGFRLVSLVDPGLKANKFNDTIAQGIKADVFLKFPDGKLCRGPVWPGDCYFPDFTDPAVRIWWGSLYRPLTESGIAGFWNDMNEPAVFSGGERTLPRTVHHAGEGKVATHAEIHNVYGLQMARATWEGLNALRPQRRPFVLSRAGFTGIQRYAAVWTGDNESTWDHLRLSLSMVFNLGLSGVAFAGPDIGGFYGTSEPELFIRWLQAAALFPLCRIHTASHTPHQEPWSFGPQVEAAARKIIERRYRLLPYLYTAFWQAHRTGVPIVRPLLVDFQDDPQAEPIEDQFMVGEQMLVAPILSPATTSRPVYLPRPATWVDYWTGAYHCGGETITVEAPLDHLPLFVRAGTILPHWPLIEHTDQAKTIETIDFHAFIAPGQSDLYEDEGEGLAYRQGQHRQTRFVCRADSERIIITARIEGEYNPPYQMINWIIHTAEKITPTVIIADGLPIVDWSDGPLPNSFTFQSPLLQRLEIQYWSR